MSSENYGVCNTLIIESDIMKHYAKHVFA